MIYDSLLSIIGSISSIIGAILGVAAIILSIIFWIHTYNEKFLNLSKLHKKYLATKNKDKFKNKYRNSKYSMYYEAIFNLIDNTTIRKENDKND